MAPEGKSVPEEPDLGPKEFGPQAVYISGKLGNYEPLVVKQTGPGETWNTIMSFCFNQTVSDRLGSL